MQSKNIDKWSKARAYDPNKVVKINRPKNESKPNNDDINNEQTVVSSVDVLHESLDKIIAMLPQYEEEHAYAELFELFYDHYEGKLRGIKRTLSLTNEFMTDDEVEAMQNQQGDDDN